MGKPTGFLEYQREPSKKRAVEERVKDYEEVDMAVDEGQSLRQSARCMDCGIPFCHKSCPLGNNIPEFNDAVYQENWKLAYEILSTTNNFPEFTGRICPAPCESSCVLGINKPPVAIEFIEKAIIEKAFESGWVQANLSIDRTDKSIAVIGSGPAGLAAADQLNRAGHRVTVFERADQIGGLLRYGIPDFKLDKQILDRRLDLLKREGVRFKTGINVGTDLHVHELERDFDAVLLCLGSTVPRDLVVEGRDGKGVHFAMDYLSQQNKRVAANAGKEVEQSVNYAGVKQGLEISAKGKTVVVIGGGDTGSDCMGTANRQGADAVIQLEIMPQPPEERDERTPWPEWPFMLRTSSSHEEGCRRSWAVSTKSFLRDIHGDLKALQVVNVDWVYENGKYVMKQMAGTDRVIPCELALVAAGFLHPQKNGLLQDLGLSLDNKGNIETNKYKTSRDKFYAAGDARRGQSLVVWAISEGREAARQIDQDLMGRSFLEAKSTSMIGSGFLER